MKAFEKIQKNNLSKITCLIKFVGNIGIVLMRRRQ
jgi:hypothetical protein